MEPTDEQLREEMRRAVEAFKAANPPKIAGFRGVLGEWSMADASLRIGRKGGREEASTFIAEMRDDRGLAWESVFGPWPTPVPRKSECECGTLQPDQE